MEATAGRRGRYQHSDAPRPAPDATNAFIEREVTIPGVTNPDGSPVIRVELAPCPETWPGGLYKNSAGQLVDARGVSLDVDPAAREFTTGELIAELARHSEAGPDLHPAVQQAIARERQKEREQSRGFHADNEDTRGAPPELPGDVQDRKRYGKAARPLDA